MSATSLLPEALVLGDLNEDGILDAVVGAVPVGPDPNLEVLLGTGTGRFTHLAEMNNGSANAIYEEALDLGDMNADGHLDVVSNTFTAISVLPGNGDGTFDPAIVSGVGSGTGETVRVRDFDGDGNLDVVTATWTGNNDDAESMVHLNLGNGDGTVDWAQTFVIDANHPHGDAADLNGDGLPDLAITGTAGHAQRSRRDVRGDQRRRRRSPRPFITTRRRVSLALGDLNGDARPEAVLTGVGRGACRCGRTPATGRSSRTRWSWWRPDSPYEVESANLLGSAKLDLAVLGSAINPSRLALYENRPGPTVPELLDRPGAN